MLRLVLLNVRIIEIVLLYYIRILVISRISI